MEDGRVRRPGRWRAVVAVVALGALVAACSQRQGGSPELAALPTSTTQPSSGNLSPTTVGDVLPRPQGESFGRIRAELDQAVGDRDLCALVSALNAALPDVEDPQAVVDTYRKVSTSVAAATDFVPPELSEAWQTVIDTTATAAEATERSGGDINDPALSGAFATSDFETASLQIDAWRAAECPVEP